MCEGYFMRTYKQGRFIVFLPTKKDQLKKLRQSKDLAVQRLKKLEKRFEKL